MAIFVSCKSSNNSVADSVKELEQVKEEPGVIQLGAERMDQYLKALQGKRVALVVNQTSVIGKTHLVDTLLQLGIDVKKVFAPEHGFRGKEDAGASISDEIDAKTGIPIVPFAAHTALPQASSTDNRFPSLGL